MRAEELSRKARIAARARAALGEARLPPRMEMWERTVGRRKRALSAGMEKSAEQHRAAVAELSAAAEEAKNLALAAAAEEAEEREQKLRAEIAALTEQHGTAVAAGLAGFLGGQKQPTNVFNCYLVSITILAVLVSHPIGIVQYISTPERGN